MEHPGRLWFRFTLFGLPWEARVLPASHPKMENCQGLCFINKRFIYFAHNLSHEQFRITLAHELQHVIEDAADVDFERGVEEDVHDRWTDQLARGWIYLLRHCPEIVAFLQGQPSPLDQLPAKRK